MTKQQATSDAIAIIASLVLAALFAVYAVAAVAGQAGGGAVRPSFDSPSTIVDFIADDYGAVVLAPPSECNQHAFVEDDVACLRVIQSIERLEPWLDPAIDELRKFAAGDKLGFYADAYESLVTADLARDLLTQAYHQGDSILWAQGIVDLGLAGRLWRSFLQSRPTPRLSID